MVHYTVTWAAHLTVAHALSQKDSFQASPPCCVQYGMCWCMWAQNRWHLRIYWANETVHYLVSSYWILLIPIICLFFISSAQLQTDWFAIELTEHWNRNPRVQGAMKNRKLGACIIYPDSCVPYWDSNSVAEWVFKYVWKRGTVILFFLYSLNHKRHRTSLNKITLKVPPRYTSNIFLINRSLCNATWSNVGKRQHVARCMASCESLWSPFGEVILRKLTASPWNEAIQNCRLQDNFIVTQRK